MIPLFRCGGGERKKRALVSSKRYRRTKDLRGMGAPRAGKGVCKTEAEVGNCLRSSSFLSTTSWERNSMEG